MWIFSIVTLLLVFITTGSDPAEPLTVMTFNIRYGTADDGDNSWPHRDHLVKQVLRDREAPIVGLQEALAFQIEEITDELPHYAVIGVGRDDGRARGEFSAILYDARLFFVDASGTFWLSDTPEVTASKSWGNGITRICTWARLIHRRTGDAMYIYNTHFDYRSAPSRIESAKLVANRIAQRPHNDPVILMGDFNAGENTDEINSILNGTHGPAFTNAFRAIQPDTTDVGTYNAFKGDRFREMVDHVFVTTDVTVLDADIDHVNENGQYPSDHYPVWATIQLP
jgi:endonuclease/exonuclease/phosphatase family metal-dependent hydrolase